MPFWVKQFSIRHWYRLACSAMLVTLSSCFTVKRLCMQVVFGFGRYRCSHVADINDISLNITKLSVIHILIRCNRSVVTEIVKCSILYKWKFRRENLSSVHWKTIGINLGKRLCVPWQLQIRHWNFTAVHRRRVLFRQYSPALFYTYQLKRVEYKLWYYSDGILLWYY